MHARVLKAVLGPNKAWEAERIVDVLAAVQGQYEGFVGVRLLANYEDGEYVSISFWKTKEDAVQAYQAIRNQLELMIGNSFQWEPTAEYFDVYIPKQLSLD